MKNILYYTIILCIISCSSKPKHRDVPAMPKELELELPERITFNRSEIISDYLDILDQYLKKDSIPEFILNECLDKINMHYCKLNSHQYISLRYDLLDSLSCDDLEKLMKYKENPKLNSVCNYGYNTEMIYQNVSTKNLIASKLSEMKCK